MPRGSSPGERRGGRKPGTPNRATIGVAARAKTPGGSDAVRAPTQAEFDSLEHMRTVSKLLLQLIVDERGKPKPNAKAIADLCVKASRVLADIAPYDHPKRQAVAPAVAASIEKDGTVKIQITTVDAAL